MKKNTTVIGLVVLVLAIAYYFFILKDSNLESSDEAYSDFAIKDTANVVAFTITDTENNTISISRENDGKRWMIAGSDFEAQMSNVNMLMETFHRIKIKQDVAENAIENVLTQLAVRHKKVEIFMDGDTKKPAKTWYVGSGTNDHMGTYMLLMKNGVKSSTPYITYKPDMYGTLDVRFFTDFQLWRSSKVFSYKPDEINEIDVKFNETPDKSYIIKTDGQGNVSLFDGVQMPVLVFDSSQVKHYLTHYKKIHFESTNINLNQEQVDSVMTLTPHYEIKVVGNDNRSTSVRVWKMQLPLDHNARVNNGTIWNPERAWCSINGANELVKIQFYSWDVLFKPKDYFTK